MTQEEIIKAVEALTDLINITGKAVKNDVINAANEKLKELIPLLNKK